MDKYFTKDDQDDFELGNKDGLAGKMNSRMAKSISAYMSGWEEGSEARARSIREKRIQNITKARKSKNKKEGEK